MLIDTPKSHKYSTDHRREKHREQKHKTNITTDRITTNRTTTNLQKNLHLPKLLCSLIVVFALIASMVAITYSSTDEAYASSSVSYTCGEELHYGEHGWVTHKMNCDNATAYCVQPNLNAPPNGTYQKGSLSPTNASVENIRALLWFGYGGPGFDPAMWPSYYSDGTVMYSNLYYVLTHVVLANYYYSKDAHSSLKGLSESERNWLSSNIMPFQDGSFGYSSGNNETFVGRCFARKNEVPAAFECFNINAGKATQTIISFVATGELNVSKVSANHSITDYNSCYSTNGIVYDVYSDSSCHTWIGDVRLDSSGNSNKITVSQGKYYLRERQDSCISTGYAYDNTIHEINVIAGRQNTLRVEDPPQYATPELLISKCDAESNLSTPLGGATLEGAQFQIDFYGGQFDSADNAENSGTKLRSWVFSTDKNGKAMFSKDFLVSGDAPYTDRSGNIVLPLGTILIKEICPPTGYILHDAKIHLCKITPSGTDEIVKGYIAPIHPNQVKRGDLKFVKTNEADMSRLSNVAFRLTSETTGESHLLITDENGCFNSASEWNPHTSLTNSNDNLPENEWNSEAGIWFGLESNGDTTAPNDSLGALPYDKYSLTELRCKSNENSELITIEHITIKRDSTCIDLGTIDDPLKQTQYISSSAYDGLDLDKTFSKNTDATLVDSIDFTNLIPGETYTLKSQLVYKESGDAVLNNGNTISAEKTFTANNSNGKTNVELKLDTSLLESDNVVFFETLYKGDTLIAQDCDLNNPDQTLRLQEPQIKTLALDALDSDKYISADRNACIVDNVAYSNLVSNATYTLVGTLMIADSADSNTDESNLTPALDNTGNPISSTVEFTTEVSNGQIDTSFQFDAFRFADNTKLVVFEKLYQNGSLICEHCDANDENQSVFISRPSIDTFAYDIQSNTKLASIDERIHLADTVTYENLSPNESYTLVGVLMDSSTELPFVIEESKGAPDDNLDPSNPQTDSSNSQSDYSNPQEASNTGGNAHSINELLPDNVANAKYISSIDFSPETSNGEAIVNFDIDNININNFYQDDENTPYNIVIYEYLIQNDEIVARHEDISDNDQMISLAKPNIHTEALDKSDGDHTIAPLDNRSIVDTVYYENLIPGKEYSITGYLMDKSSSSNLTDDENAIERTVLFTPNSPSGHVEVEFALNAENMDGKEIVAFEYLFKDDLLLATHADINDEAQSISVSSNEGGMLPQTGDNLLSDRRLITFLDLIALIVSLIFTIGMAKRRTTTTNTKHDRLIDSLYKFS